MFVTVFFALLISVASAQSELCSVCQLVVTYTESFIQKNESEQVIIQQLDALCTDLPLFGPQVVPAFCVLPPIHSLTISAKPSWPSTLLN